MVCRYVLNVHGKDLSLTLLFQLSAVVDPDDFQAGYVVGEEWCARQGDDESEVWRLVLP